MVPDLSQVLVAGLGVTGKAVIEALKAHGHEVFAVDDRPTSVAAVAEKLGVQIFDSTSSTELERALSRATSVIPSPGIPGHHLLYQLADTSGTEILKELGVLAPVKAEGEYRMLKKNPLVVQGTMEKPDFFLLMFFLHLHHAGDQLGF